jgi:hypothetical protein
VANVAQSILKIGRKRKIVESFCSNRQDSVVSDEENNEERENADNDDEYN